MLRRLQEEDRKEGTRDRSRSVFVSCEWACFEWLCFPLVKRQRESILSLELEPNPKRLASPMRGLKKARKGKKDRMPSKEANIFCLPLFPIMSHYN